MPRRMAGVTWLFDLDNTLHDASYRIFPALDASMNHYLELYLGVDATEANRLRRDYWDRYGATLLGLIRHHDVNAHHFLRETHRFIEDPARAALIRAERGLARNLSRLPGRKILLTNAPTGYALYVLREIGLARHFVRHYAIEQMRMHARFRPKPSQSMLRMVLSRERIRPTRAVLVEDTPANLKSARALGMRTVLVTGHTPAGPSVRKTRPCYVDLRVKSIAQLLQRHRQLR